ncbi:MAG: SseB family protein [Marinibacterium sp.]|nr:SseB family protein [Marinibacterium sp.]
MTDLTPLDTAHAGMEAAPEDDTARLRFYERLADSELMLLLTEEARDDTANPRLFETSSGTFVLAFDREDRLTRFTGEPVPYLALSGRSLAGMLAGQGVGLGLNLDVAPSEILIPAGALDWLTDTLTHAPDVIDGDIAELRAPGNLPDHLLAALDTKLATTGGLADHAYLAGTLDAQGGAGHVLAFIGAPDKAQPALAAAVGEALTFSGIEAGTLDVAFFEPSDPIAARLVRTGLRFDLPKPPEPETRLAPGSNPGKPPILR